MTSFRRLMIALALLLTAGCILFPGTIDEQLPKLRDKLPHTTRVYLPNPLHPNGGFLYTRNGQVVNEAFRRALTDEGIGVYVPPRRSVVRAAVLEDAQTNACDVVLFTDILSWQYGEAGFTGFGGRDEVTLSVMLVDPAHNRVLARAQIYVANGIGLSAMSGTADPDKAVAPIIRRYVRKVFVTKEEEEAEKEKK